MSSTPIWRPNATRIKQSQMESFRLAVADKEKIELADYWDLYQWSVNKPASFWKHAADFLQIRWRQRGQEVLRPAPANGHPIMDARWFPDFQLNFAENLLPDKDDQTIRVISYVEGLPEARRYQGKDIYKDVASCVQLLKKLGVKRGDRVAGVVANTAETLIAMLATSAIGAIWTSCSPDFGETAIVERFGQVKPKILFATLSYQYNGRHCDCWDKIVAAIDQLQSVESCVLIDFFQDPRSLKIDRLKDKLFYFNEVLASYQNHTELEIEFELTPFDHPLYIMYSSGTTGVPKCIVHSAGGTLLQHKKELMLHSDIVSGKKLLYYTTCGWMMWNWMASALATGASLVLFEGSISYPSLHRIWQVLADEQVHVFGTSPKFLASCQQSGLRPGREHELQELATILSTGSPLLPEQFDWVYRELGPDLHLASISGGTDIISCFMLGVPTLPVYRGEIQAPGLGMAIDCWDDEGNSLREQKGELVCKGPFPSAPIGFWNDPDRRRYRAAYFEDFADRGVWRHGDYIEFRKTGGIVVHGRSDATLNPGGIRIGTAEIYRLVESENDIADSVVVDSTNATSSDILLFLKMQEGETLSQERIQQIKMNIRSQLSPRHVPAFIFQVKDIPYTRSGKKLELAVKSAVAGEQIPNLSAVANPESIDEYYQIGERYRSS